MITKALSKSCRAVNAKPMAVKPVNAPMAVAAKPNYFGINLVTMVMTAAIMFPQNVYASPDIIDKIVNIEEKELPSIMTQLTNFDRHVAEGITHLVDNVENELADVSVAEVSQAEYNELRERIDVIENEVEMIKALMSS